MRLLSRICRQAVRSAADPRAVDLGAFFAAFSGTIHPATLNKSFWQAVSEHVDAANVHAKYDASNLDAIANTHSTTNKRTLCCAVFVAQ